MNMTMDSSFKYDDYMREDEWDEIIARAFDAGDVPQAVQDRLGRTYVALKKIPQTPPLHKRPTRRMFRAPVAIAVALICALFTGAAFAASSLISMGQGNGAFFADDKNLPIYSSLEDGAKALSADVGQTASIEGVQVAFDSISCDRNVANLYFTLTREDGFDLEKASMYDGSKEAAWPRVQRYLPHMDYVLEDNEGCHATGVVNTLDAYLEGDSIKCMMRITPEKSMGEEVRIDLATWSQGEQAPTFSVGLDLHGVSAPREIGERDVTFNTVQGEKTIGIERFTASELATVMVVRNDEVFTEEDSGRPVSDGVPESALAPYNLMITDDMGNTLVPVGAGDGAGIDLQGAYVSEYARLDPNATSITITPMLFVSENVREDKKRIVDASVPGARMEMNEFGGYDIVSREVKDGSVAITLRPYGWVPSNGGETLRLEADISMLEDHYSDPDTGEELTGLHSGLNVIKCDYITGDVMDMTFYYSASDEELAGLTEYRYYAFPEGAYVKDDAAAVVLAFS